MDGRKALPPGAVLDFPGMRCVVEEEVGRGSNAIVYRGRYADTFHGDLSHYVLIKELFPLHPRDAIYRDGENAVVCGPEGKGLWEVHKSSFEAGNHAHLTLMEAYPDQIGSNLNTYRLNNTLYTVMGLSGGVSLESQAAGEAAQLRPVAVRMLNILDALDAFHSNGLVHLDIAPDNILLVGSGSRERAMLIDFNSCAAAKASERGAGFVPSVKQGYTAPEIRNGKTEEIGYPSDLYSVAAVFFRLIYGRALTPFQMIRSQPPDISHCRCMEGLPDTVVSWTRKILRQGLQTLPKKRYQTVEQMRKDFGELLDRIDGIGITHWALWEAGRRSVQRLVRQNPSLAYVEREAELYPLRAQWENGGETMPMKEFIQALPSIQDSLALLTGPGGMGKSTALLRAVLTAPGAYSPAGCVMMYLPLSGWKNGERHYIQDHILQELRFDAATRTLEDARRALTALLREPKAGEGPMLLLLDGWNEAPGEPGELMQEILELAALPGVKILMASRTVPQGLAARQARMAPLTQEDVGEALLRHGLLTPEKKEMQRLLQTPMMLSLFIQTAQAQNSQVLCETEQELLTNYLNALCEKAGQESENARFRAEAAIYLVLPAIARKMKKQGGALDDQMLMEPVLRCRKALSGRRLNRAFPEWIGHGDEITGGADMSGDSWYGMIVQQLLWRQLGLLVRDEAGGYHILHQIIQDDLIRRDAANRRAVRSARLRVGTAAAAVAVFLLVSSVAGYEMFGWRKPYDEVMSESVLNDAWRKFNSCNLQIEAMENLLSGQLEAAPCADQVKKNGAKALRTVLVALADMQSDASRVIPWSQAPFDFDHCAQLLSLPAAQAEEYQAYIQGYELVRGGGTETSPEDYAKALRPVLEAERDIAQLLCQIVCMPHMNSDNQNQTWVSIKANMSTDQLLAWSLSSIAQASQSEKTMSVLIDALELAYQRRQEAISNMNFSFVELPPAAA